jgi:hypothetical protein
MTPERKSGDVLGEYKSQRLNASIRRWALHDQRFFEEDRL